jgi:aminomethyltransferase
MKRTPLFAAHQRLGGKLIEFGGWEMPVQYTSIVDEHLTVRKAAGLFDISHMGEVLVSGPAAEPFLNQTLTNDVRKLAPGQGQYTLLCNEHGGVIDDLYAYRLAPLEYLLIINASRIQEDVAWLEQQLGRFARRSDALLKNASDATGASAVQGPRVVEFIDQCFPGPAIGGTPTAKPTGLKKNQIAKFHFGPAEVWVSRTGYTGEDGFEVAATLNCSPYLRSFTQ